MTDLTILRKSEVLTINELLLKALGGHAEIEQESELDYALAAVESRSEDEGVDLVDCAAAYAYHFSLINTFADRSKLVAAAVTELFVEVNGAKLSCSDNELVELFQGIAKGEISRAEVENSFREWIG